MTPELNRKIRNTKEAIIATVNDDVSEKRKPAETIKALIEAQDVDTIKWILSETVKNADYDGRYYKSTIDWARQIYIPVLHSERSDYASLNLHPCHINSLVQALIAE
jgi:hypothetical protein